MNLTIKNGGEYYNKNRRCLWVELHDGTTHKFIVQGPEDARENEPHEWHIANAQMISDMTHDLLAGEPIADVQKKYHIDRSDQ